MVSYRAAVFFLATIQLACSVDWLQQTSDQILALRGPYQQEKSDIIFLVDTSGSLSGSDFNEIKTFVRNLMNEISIAFEATRIEVIPFGETAGIFIDYISNPGHEKNKCLFNEQFNPMVQSIYGWMTNMRDAFQLANDVCFGPLSGAKRDQVSTLRTVVILLTDGHWNWPWADSSPVSRARALWENGVLVIAIGVGSVTIQNLQSLVQDPSQHAFHLNDFNEFAQLATYIRGDPYQQLFEVDYVDASKCNDNCDTKAKCSCGQVYGAYSCGCKEGYYGTGETGKCTLCPQSTFKNFTGRALACDSCPANSGHSTEGSIARTDCQCHTGYEGTPADGSPCSIRVCPTLLAPSNGIIKGICERYYDYTCVFEGLEGYELSSGDETRTCQINSQNIMAWSGSTTTYTEIRCPITQVIQALVPAGTCRSPDGSIVHDLVYTTKCTFECNRGHNLVGNQNTTCQLDKSWNPVHPTCEEVRCPKLASVPVGTFSPSTCTTGTMRFDSSCALTCPSGYHIHTGPITLTTDTRRCYTNGSWEYRAVTPTCRDYQDPIPECPSDPELFFDNNPGTNVATVTWPFDFTDNSLTAGDPSVTKDSFTVTLKIGVGDDVSAYKTYNTSFPKLLEIGQKTVRYEVTDPTGNSASCTFRVVVRDTEPPVCGFCPADIVIHNATVNSIRVNWDQPNCTDNSGVPPSVQANRNSGDLVDVPGSYSVQYKYTDGDNNEYTNCSFRISLKKQSCPMYAPPKNGALVCNYIGEDPSCSVLCNKNHDFKFTPPFLYFCSLGKWEFFSISQYDSTLPWPDCSTTANPTFLKQAFAASFFYAGDCHDPNVQDTLKTQFLDLLNGRFIPGAFCKNKPDQCNETSVRVFCGDLTAPDRRRKRSTNKQVTFRYDNVEKDTGLTQGTNDQAGQVAFNAKKAELQPQADQVQAGFNQVNWVEYQAQTGLELDNGNTSHIQVGDYDAYCSEDGAVVAKCDDADLNCWNPPCKCNKGSGTISKCLRCPVGTYYDWDADDCLRCPEGTFNGEEGALQSCQPCPDGFWTFGDRKENFTSCSEECGPGFFSTTGIAKCFRCPVGTYSSEERNTVCHDCPAGTVTVIDAAGGIENCGMQCAPGTYSTNGVEPCLPCPVGTYQPGTGKTACLPCPGQESTHGTGASSTVYCEEVDTCVSSPCMNGGTCVNSKEGYLCQCPSGFLGTNCETDSNECVTNPCYEGSTCVDKAGSRSCLCTAEKTGEDCELSYNLCTQRTPCTNGAGCVFSADQFTCQCAEGYGETFCEFLQDKCASSPCQNNGVCIRGLDSYTCNCQPGYTGVNCQINIDDCESNPCQNGGTCVDALSSYSCTCKTGYSGFNCETEIDHCIGQPCKEGGTCVNSLTGYTCTCKPSYHSCRCTQELSSDFDMSLQVRAVKSYSQVTKPIPDLSALTMAFWMRTKDTNPGTVLSYATTDGDIVQDNGLALQDYAAFNLFVNNKTVYTGLKVNDGQWHHVAVTWESAGGTWKAYKDGVNTLSSTTAFQAGEIIKGSGILILGQEQDELGGGFNTEENFIGDVSQMNLWNNVLSANDIYNLAYSCSHVKGNVAAWGDFGESVHGDYHITTKSYGCEFSNDLRKFAVTYKRYLPGNDDSTIENTTPENCASSCLTEQSFICRSFDFENTTNKCYLSSSYSDGTDLQRSVNYGYYELNCLKTFGVSTPRKIPDADMSASTQHASKSAAHFGRLHQQEVRTSQGEKTATGAWVALTNDANQHLQVKLGAISQISAVATQGRSDDAQWVTSYNLQYSLDSLSWTDYPGTLAGNTDQHTVVRHELHVFLARYVRLKPVGFNAQIAMRMELYGCPPLLEIPPDTNDECSNTPCQNGGTCVNRYNAYICECPSGYSGTTCGTADPCAALGAPIHGTKSSSNYNAGSTITFTCNAGFSLQGSSSRTCQSGAWTGTHPKCRDVDECASTPCNQWCTNTVGSYICHCHKGYELQGETTCVDINECSLNNGGCSHTCHNTAGSFTCTCPSGRVLDSGGRSCKDIDECASANGGCEHTCINTLESYDCVCRQGYILNGDSRTCAARTCPSLSNPSNGQVSLSSALMLGSTATYTCNNGYRTSYSPTRICQADGLWSGGDPSCIRVFCEEIGQVEHATRQISGQDGNQNIVGTTATFTCAANFAMVGDAARTCEVDGMWSGTQPRCIASFCSAVPVPTNGAVQGHRFEEGATLRISCDEGHNLVPASSSFRTCVSNGQGGGTWTGQDPICELVDCGDPGDPYGGSRHIAKDTKYQSVVTYTCQAQHHLEGEDSQTCLRNGSWSGAKPVCLERSCGNPGTPTNGAKIGSVYKYTDTVTFSCNAGYTLQGSSSRTCVEADGLWTGTQPTCQIVNCGDPGAPTNGIYFGDKFTYQSTLVFECNPQYKLVGDLSRTCQASGQWSGSQPSCAATSCGTFKTGPSGTVISTNYPANYDNDEYCTWEIRVPVDKKVRLDFTEFKTETGRDYLFIYDTNEIYPTISFDGTTHIPPSFTSSGNVVRVRFISNGDTTRKGFSFNYQQTDLDCGGVIKGGSGPLSSPGYPNGYANNLDCVWLLYRIGESVDFVFQDFNTEFGYDIVRISHGRFGETVDTNSWGGLSVPSGSFYTDTYLWIQFTTNGGNQDGVHHTGWTGTYQKYWPYVNKKKRK